MVHTGNKLKTVFIGAVLWVCLLSFIVIWLHFTFEYRQAQREVIYLKARQQAAIEKRQHIQQYGSRRQKEELTRRYRKGHLVNLNPEQ